MKPISAGKPYTRAEIERLGNQLPDRGIYCPRCSMFIPQFADLTTADMEELKQFDSGLQVVKRLRDKTGCSITWGKLVLNHLDGPHAPDPTSPCPYCGVPLHPTAGQCLLCRMDWHDPENPVRLGESIAERILNAPVDSTIVVKSHSVYRLALLFIEQRRPNDRLTVKRN
ncbi:hypothetical protein Mal35_47840 [Gimesia maris]|uniref:hypothetical protein n=1 Tax=Gimesia maris TaxID=122 RepID=UPI001188FD36|nr:hypothetical protein [Gimesia maris]QDT81303.1 hypothetical protein Mal35_47840 [Gimesia maris]